MNDISLDISILKTILNNRKAGLEFAQENSEKLLNADLWKFARLVIDYIKVYKEVPTKSVLIEKCNKNETLIGYVDKTFNKIDAAKNNEKEFKFELEKLKRRYQISAIKNLRGLLEKNNEDLIKDISSIQSTLTSIKEVDTQKVYAQYTLKEGIENFKERFKARKENPDLAKGIFTGLTALDYITNGLKSPSYVLCCGNSGSGKSTLLLSMAANMFMGNNTIDSDKFYSSGESVIYYSLEIPYEECFDKLISYISKVPLRAIETTDLTDEQKERINKTLKFIKNYNQEFLIVDIPKGATASQMEAIFTDFLERNNKSKVVAIDYLGIMDSDNKDIDQDWLKQASISEELYKFARVNDLVLLTGVQLNEPGQTKNDGSNMGIHRLSRSKAIVNPSTLCLMIDKRPEENSYPTTNIFVVKNRRGPLGQFSLRKAFETCGFVNDIGFTEEVKNSNDGDISLLLEKFDEKSI